MQDFVNILPLPLTVVRYSPKALGISESAALYRTDSSWQVEKK